MRMAQLVQTIVGLLSRSRQARGKAATLSDQFYEGRPLSSINAEISRLEEDGRFPSGELRDAFGRPRSVRRHGSLPGSGLTH
jgi:hypothetical protein